MVFSFFKALLFVFLSAAPLFAMKLDTQQSKKGATSKGVKAVEPATSNLAGKVTGNRVKAQVPAAIEAEDSEETEAEVAVPGAQGDLYPKAYFDREILGALTKLIAQETKGIWAAYFECEHPKFLKAWQDRVIAARKAGLNFDGGLFLNHEARKENAL